MCHLWHSQVEIMKRKCSTKLYCWYTELFSSNTLGMNKPISSEGSTNHCLYTLMFSGICLKLAWPPSRLLLLALNIQWDHCIEITLMLLQCNTRILFYKAICRSKRTSELTVTHITTQYWMDKGGSNNNRSCDVATAIISS